MDINFIQIEHRQNVLKLMEICGVEMEQAYQLYTATGFNFEAAINRKFNPPPQQPQIPPEQVYDPYPAQQDPGAEMYDPDGFYQDDDDVEYTHFKEFKKNGKSFDKKYPVKAHQNLLQSFIPKFFKGSEDNTFKKKLQDYLGRRSNIKCDPGNISQSLAWCWKQKFPMAVILLDFSANVTPIIRRFFSEELLIDKVISQQFKAYGMNTKEYELEPELKPFFNLERDANSIVICRVNNLDEINIVSRISLDDHIDEIKKKVKQAKSACIQNELDQSHISRQFTEELRGNFNYQRPKTIKESIKQREDKKLRKQQEDQFFRACQPKGEPKGEPKGKEEQRLQKQQIIPSEIRQNHKQQIKPAQQEYKQEIRPAVRQVRQEMKPEVKPAPVPVISEEKVRATRLQKQSRLKKYSDGIMFKIRLPSGSNIMVSAGRQEFIQYLFDYVECQPDDLGFADELGRNFDISIGFGGSQTLRGKERKKIKDIFEDSEVLIVREL